MFSILLHCAPQEEDVLSAELSDAGTAGITDEPGGLRAFFDVSDPAPLLTRFAIHQPELRQEKTIDWARISEDAWPPLLIGEKFFLAPPWRTELTPPGRLRLTIVPGLGCGTGHHPSTQLSLEAMERYLKPGGTFIDVGAGSGILSAAALLLEAGRIVACDIDPEAAGVVHERVPVPLFIGSAPAIRSGIGDVVVANISAVAVDELAADLRRICKPGGTLILAGFPESDLPRNFEPKIRTQKGEWVCWIV